MNVDKLSNNLKTWKELAPELQGEGGTISRSLLHALHYTQLCAVCYDVETPDAVLQSLKYHPDASVRAATRQRGDVLAGNLLNPFLLQ